MPAKGSFDGVLTEFYGSKIEFLCTSMVAKGSFEKTKPLPVAGFIPQKVFAMYFWNCITPLAVVLLRLAGYAGR